MNQVQEVSDTSVPDIPVRGFLHVPPGSGNDCLVLTHGAGANAQSPLLRALADTFCAAGLIVLRCDLPFRQARSHGPPPRGSAERDQEGLQAAVALMRHRGAGRIFLGGHSYGGRQASLLAARERSGADGLVLLSYPLHPPRKPDQLRTGHFPQLHTPALFVHGTQDPFGSIPEMEEALQFISGRTMLLRVPDAGHELLSIRNRDSLPPAIAEAFLSFFAH